MSFLSDESKRMADCQPRTQLLNFAPVPSEPDDKITVNNNDGRQAELALRLFVEDINKDVSVDQPLSATKPVTSEQQRFGLGENTTEINPQVYKAVILTLPPPSPIEPQAGDRVAHRPELRWETRDGALFYREPGETTPSTTAGEVVGPSEVFWGPSGYFSMYSPTEQEKQAENCNDKAVLDDGFAFYYCSSLDNHPVYHDLATDQRYYFHKRQSLCDPSQVARSAVREKYQQMVGKLERKSLEPVEVLPTVVSPGSPDSLVALDYPVAWASPISPDSSVAVASPIVATSTTQEAPIIKDDDNIVIGTKRSAPVTPEGKPPAKRVKTACLSPSVRENKPAVPPVSLLPAAPGTSDFSGGHLTIQQRAYMEDLRDIKHEPLISDKRPEIVHKVLFDKSEGLLKSTSLKPSSSMIEVMAGVNTTGSAPVSLTTSSTAQGSQDNPISLEETPEKAIRTPPSGTASNPIAIELLTPKKVHKVVIISPVSSRVSYTPSPGTASTADSSRSSAPSPEPAMGRLTRSADKKIAAAAGVKTPPRDGLEFYNTNDWALLRYQDIDKDKGVIPGTLLLDGRQPDRLLIDKFRADCSNSNDGVWSRRNAATKGSTGFSPKRATIHPKNTPLHGEDYWDEWLRGQKTQTQTQPVADPFTSAARQRWLDDAPKSSNQPPLLRGFPMVEMVTFLRADNRQDEGNCYWNALALHMYGRLDFGPRVKLEHLRFVEAVLCNPMHPRHEAYTKINGRFFQTNAQGLKKNGPFIANMWQMLHLPGSWTPSWMTQVTADLYGVFIVLYTLESESVRVKRDELAGGKHLLVTETTTRGAYNSRHIFLLFVDGNHYQPMIPNEYDPSEFRCPRPAKALTRYYIFGDSKRWGDGVGHGWRRDVSFGNRVPMSLPVDHNMGATLVHVERLIKATIEGSTGSWKAER